MLAVGAEGVVGVPGEHDELARRGIEVLVVVLDPGVAGQPVGVHHHRAGRHVGQQIVDVGDLLQVIGGRASACRKPRDHVVPAPRVREVLLPRERDVAARVRVNERVGIHPLDAAQPVKRAQRLAEVLLDATARPRPRSRRKARGPRRSRPAARAPSAASASPRGNESTPAARGSSNGRRRIPSA